ncbi:hypothetical protein [Pelosinus fermentans]|uniref:Uncharacterized protein n=1 Tax=Pelosinus fermentans JBW45 TaxID=1192197 RepID=I8TNU1_9FIRM|nr:hypothetical protein [Pelosinus fermentans]AJQ29019.1 hypothetical protein JBW_03682 [Pelosinus fermentans JBW45]
MAEISNEKITDLSRIEKKMDTLIEIASYIKINLNNDKKGESSALIKYTGIDMIPEVGNLLNDAGKALLALAGSWVLLVKLVEMGKKSKDVYDVGKKSYKWVNERLNKKTEKSEQVRLPTSKNNSFDKSSDLEAIAQKYNQSFGRALNDFRDNLKSALSAYKTSLAKLVQNNKTGNKLPIVNKVRNKNINEAKERLVPKGGYVTQKQERVGNNLPSNSLIAYSNQMPKAAKAVEGLTRSQRMLNTVMNANPIGRLIQLGTLLYENWDTIKVVLDSVWAKFQETFPGLAKIVETYVGVIIEFWTQLPDNIMAALGSVYEIITGAFSSAFDWLSQKFSWIQGAWNGLFGGGNMAGEAPGDVQSNARGGIIMHPILTTFAEEGPEAAIPLDGSSRAVSLWYTAGRMLGMFEGQQQQPGLGSALPVFGGDSAKQGIVVSAPINITINGNADSNTVQQVQQAAQAALMDLKRQLKELQWQERRVSFG